VPLLLAMLVVSENLNLDAILGALFLVLLLVVRGAPALVPRHDLGRGKVVAAGLLQATSLSLLRRDSGAIGPLAEPEQPQLGVVADGDPDGRGLEG
jgi:hypothetical protein